MRLGLFQMDFGFAQHDPFLFLPSPAEIYPDDEMKTLNIECPFQRLF